MTYFPESISISYVLRTRISMGMCAVLHRMCPGLRVLALVEETMRVVDSHGAKTSRKLGDCVFQGYLISGAGCGLSFQVISRPGVQSSFGSLLFQIHSALRFCTCRAWGMLIQRKGTTVTLQESLPRMYLVTDTEKRLLTPRSFMNMESVSRKQPHSSKSI